MTDKVPEHAIELIVGTTRHPVLHYARAVSAERQVYILHSQECRDYYFDLRDCPYSRALDKGITEAEWPMDQPVLIGIWDGRLTTEEYM
jgi:hypothetical protein